MNHIVLKFIIMTLTLLCSTFSIAAIQVSATTNQSDTVQMPTWLTNPSSIDYIYGIGYGSSANANEDLKRKAAHYSAIADIYKKLNIKVNSKEIYKSKCTNYDCIENWGGTSTLKTSAFVSESIFTVADEWVHPRTGEMFQLIKVNENDKVFRSTFGWLESIDYPKPTRAISASGKATIDNDRGIGYARNKAISSALTELSAILNTNVENIRNEYTNLCINSSDTRCSEKRITMEQTTFVADNFLNYATILDTKIDENDNTVSVKVEINEKNSNKLAELFNTTNTVTQQPSILFNESFEKAWGYPVSSFGYFATACVKETKNKQQDKNFSFFRANTAMKAQIDFAVNQISKIQNNLSPKENKVEEIISEILSSSSIVKSSYHMLNDQREYCTTITLDKPIPHPNRLAKQLFAQEFIEGGIKKYLKAIKQYDRQQKVGRQ